MVIEEVISITPKVLEINDELEKVGNFYLPFSTGFEIECSLKNNRDINIFKDIPNIMEVRGGYDELRFRIPPGIIGLNCLYDISVMLKENAKLNFGSGIHYHVDATDWFEYVDQTFIDQNKLWVLQELESWNYQGGYNNRDMAFHRCWVRCHENYKTFEFRIGEMTFDYEVLFQRIVSANSITQKLKNKVADAILIKENPGLAYAKDVHQVLKKRKVEI